MIDLCSTHRARRPDSRRSVEMGRFVVANLWWEGQLICSFANL